MRRIVALLMKSKAGATAIEYGLIAALVAVAAIGGMALIGQELEGIFTNVGGTLQDPSSVTPSSPDSSTSTTTTSTSTGG